MSSSTRASARARNIETLLPDGGNVGLTRTVETLLSGSFVGTGWSRNTESMAHLRTSRPASFEPRIVRASPDSACPPSTSVPAVRTRRPSLGLGPPRHSAPPPPFPRPSYLDHSTLRHMLPRTSAPSIGLCIRPYPQITYSLERPDETLLPQRLSRWP